MDPLRNPKDPLFQAPEAGRELFREMGALINGRSNDAVINAACNLLINAIRQHCGSWQEAEFIFDDQFGRSKQLLKDHYDLSSGRKKGIFPYDQVIVANNTVDLDKFHRGK